jgi:hypothetical protein
MRLKPALIALCLLLPATNAGSGSADCRIAVDRDFEGRGARELESYLDKLARDHGGATRLTPKDVSLAIVRGEPKPGPDGVTAGEVACADNDGRAPYRITLYRDALAGRTLATAYRTVAHEFHHVVQIRRDKLPCGPGDKAREEYEREAREVAQRFVPGCP